MLTHALALLAAAGLSGCGDGGGASSVPTITVKPAESTPGANGGGTIDKNGTEPANGGETGTGFGTFKGKVVLMGAAPNLPPLVAQGTASRDPAVCAAKMPIPNESVVVGADKGLANVFIYLQRKPAGGKDKAAHEPAEQQEFDQMGCRYMPHAMVMRTGETVLCKNSDPVAHNVKTKPKFNQEFNPTLGPDATAELVYKNPELVPVAVECNLHNWMRAYQLPLNHPYAVTTTADGSFEIKDLPVGSHRFKVWQEKAGEVMEYTVNITKDGEVVEENIEVDSAKLASFNGPRPKTIQLSLNGR